MPDNDYDSTPCRLLTRKQLLEIIPFSYPTIWELMRRGEFPKALRIGQQKVAWREDEIREWIESRPRQELMAEDSDQGSKPNKGGNDE